jgi:hypothetical protein
MDDTESLAIPSWLDAALSRLGDTAARMEQECTDASCKHAWGLTHAIAEIQEAWETREDDTSPLSPVRNIVYNPSYGVLAHICEQQATEGYALLRWLHLGPYEDVAVFERVGSA